jgi:hypothetical protein
VAVAVVPQLGALAEVATVALPAVLRAVAVLVAVQVALEVWHPTTASVAQEQALTEAPEQPGYLVPVVWAA